MAEPPGYRGMLSAGNIDLNNRPVVANPAGGYSTVYSMSIGTDKGETVIPRVSDDGRIMSPEDAIQQYRQSGRNLGIFDTPENADAYAKQLHEDQAKQYGPQSMTQPSQEQQPQSHNHKHLAMMLEKMAVKDLAGRGRAGDTELGHLTPGDIVIPKERMTPEIKARLSDIAGGAKFDLDRFTVGHEKNSKNPNTNLPEFMDGGNGGGDGGGSSPGNDGGGEHDAAKEAASPGGNTFGGVSASGGGTNAGFGGNAVGSAGQFGPTGELSMGNQQGVQGMIGRGLGALGVNVGTNALGETNTTFDASQLGNTALSALATGVISAAAPPLGIANTAIGGFNAISGLFDGPQAPQIGDLAISAKDAIFGDAANNPNGPGTQGTNPGERGGQPGIDRIIGQNPVATPNPAAAAPSQTSAATVPQAPSVAQPATAPVRLPGGPTVSDTTGNQANLAAYLRDIGLGWFR